MADTFSILGKQFESNRGVPGNWRFTRLTQKESYRQALENLALNKRTAGPEGVLPEDAMYAEGLVETNSADDAQLATGAMKFIAAADYMLEPYKVGNVTSLDAQVLLKATRAYHFAANTLRQQQQFELSADFYLMAGRIGEVVLDSYSGREFREFKEEDAPVGVVNLAYRSLLRSRAAYLEQGSEGEAEKVFVMTHDLNRMRALRLRKATDFLPLAAWSLLSRYGTRLSRIVLMFVLWIVLLGVIVVFVDAWRMGADLAMTAKAFPDAVRLILFAHFGGGLEKAANGTVLHWAWTEVLLKIVGFVWAALLAQLIVHRAASS